MQQGAHFPLARRTPLLSKRVPASVIRPKPHSFTRKQTPLSRAPGTPANTHDGNPPRWTRSDYSGRHKLKISSKFKFGLVSKRSFNSTRRRNNLLSVPSPTSRPGPPALLTAGEVRVHTPHRAPAPPTPTAQLEGGPPQVSDGLLPPQSCLPYVSNNHPRLIQRPQKKK